MKPSTYEIAKEYVKELVRQGIWTPDLTQEERADWAYGNTKLQNDSVTREMARQAVRRKDGDGCSGGSQ